MRRNVNGKGEGAGEGEGEGRGEGRGARGGPGGGMARGRGRPRVNGGRGGPGAGGGGGLEGGLAPRPSAAGLQALWGEAEEKARGARGRGQSLDLDALRGGAFQFVALVELRIELISRRGVGGVSL